MQKRRSHTKSRRGCLNCKQRHIRCDQQGPPCANCVARSSTNTCTYPAAPVITAKKAAAAAARAVTTTAAPSPTSTPTKPPPPPPIPPSPSPRITTTSSPTTRLLELELMHRWTTRTYAGLCSVALDHHLWRVELPQRALQHPWLLDGLFAFAALDLGSSTSSRTPAAAYNRAAMTYHTASLHSFRHAVTSMTRDNHAALYLLSVAVAVLHMAALRVPRDGGDGALPSVLAGVPAFFDLVRGTGVVVLRCYGWLVESVASVAAAAGVAAATAEGFLDAGERAALVRVGRVNDALHGTTPGRGAGVAPLESSLEVSVAAAEAAFAEREREGEERGEQAVMASAHRMYGAQVMPPLVRAFAEDARGEVGMFWLNFPIFAGRRFKEAVGRCDPMALLVLMHWAVLVERHGRKAWWAAGVGRRLVEEASGVLERSEFMILPDFRDAVAWTRREVGLPDLLSGGNLFGFEVMEVNEDAE